MQCANIRHVATAVDVARVTCTFVWFRICSWGRTLSETAHALIKTLCAPLRKYTYACARSSAKGHAKHWTAVLGLAH